MKTNRMTLIALAAATSALTLLGACGRSDDGRTAGQKLDATIAKVDQKTEEAKAKSAAEAEKLGNKMEAAADKAEAKMADATITATVKTELARDPSLSALSINVDTTNGQVQLNGTAPDVASKDRATRLAAAVKGVLGVENHLVIKAT